MAPNTPKAGSSLVSNTKGDDVADADGVDDVDEAVALVVLVGGSVDVTLNTVGTAVTIGTFVLPEGLTVETETVLVVRNTVTFGWVEGEGEGVTEALLAREFED